MKDIILLIISVILAFMLSTVILDDAFTTASSPRAAKYQEATAP